MSVLMFSSCGNNNRTNEDDLGNLGQIDSNGLATNAYLSSKLTQIENSLPCVNSARRYTVGFTVQSVAGGVPTFVNRKTVSLNASNARGVYVGTTQFNDVVLVKELDNDIKEIRVRLCDVDRYGSQLSQITGAQFYSNVAVSNVTSCTVNQISAANFVLLYGNGLQEVPLQVFPVNANGPINTVCNTDFWSDPAYNGGYNGGYYNGGW